MNSNLQTLLPRLPELDARLRAADFTVSPDRWQSVYDLIYRLDREGRLPENPQGLAVLIAPLFCNNRTEQQSFYNLYRHWAGGDFESADASDEVVHHSALAQKQQHEYQRETRSRPLWAYIVVFLLLAATASYFANRLGERTLQQPADATQTLQTIAGSERAITLDPAPAPAADAEPEPARKLQPIPPRQPPEPVQLDEQGRAELRIGNDLLLSLPLALLLAWLFRRWWRKRVVLRFHRNQQNDPLMYLKLRHSNKTLPFGWGEFSQRMKRGGSIETRRLDIERTIDKTIHRAGLFTPVMLKRDPQPAYLVLMNRANPLDHDADRANSLFERLKEANVTVYRYEFHDDPRFCFSTGQSRKAYTLSQLARHYAGSRLILISDGEALIDPFSGEAQRWVRQFEAWDTRVLLTPAPQPWDAREAQLAHAGFAVAPFQVNGLEAVSDWLLKPSLDAVWFQSGEDDPLPELFALDNDAWLSGNPPPDYDPTATCGILVDYLGQSGYRLLTACAVYPQLVSVLTLTLDQILFPSDNGAAREKRLVRLTRLPWFHQGRLPDYLRRDLLARAGEAQVERINEAYRGIFARVSQAPGSQSSSLPFIAQSSGVRAYLRDLVRFAPAGSPMADSLFADVMLGGSGGPLDFVLPGGLANWLPGKRYRLWPVLVSGMIAGVVTTALYHTLDWAQPYLEESMIGRMMSANSEINIRISAHDDTRALGDALEEALSRQGFKTIDRRNAEPLQQLVKLDEKQREAIVSVVLPLEEINAYVGAAIQGLSLNVNGREYRLDFIPLDAASNVRDAINEFTRLLNDRMMDRLQQRLVSALSATAVDLSSTERIQEVMRREVRAWSREMGAAFSALDRGATSTASTGVRDTEKSKKASPRRSSTVRQQLLELISSRLPGLLTQALAQPARAIMQAYNQSLNDALEKAGEARRSQPDAIIYLPGYEQAARAVQQRLAYLGYGREYALIGDEGVVLDKAKGDGRPLHLSVNLSRPLSAGGVFRDDFKPETEEKVSPEPLDQLTLDQVENTYGPDARMAVECVRAHPAGGNDLHDCIVTSPARYCWEQGLQAPANCRVCGVNPTDCARMSVLYDQLRSDGVIPSFFEQPTLDPVEKTSGAGDAVTFADGTVISLKSNNERYLTRCNNCLPGYGVRDSITVHVDEKGFASYAHFKILADANYIGLQTNNGKFLAACENCKKTANSSIIVTAEGGSPIEAPQSRISMIRLDNGNVALGLVGQQGMYLARCEGCIPRAAQTDNAVFIKTDPQTDPLAQWELDIIKQAESESTQPQASAVACVFPDAPQAVAPAWICDAPVEGVEVSAVGYAPKSRAGASFMKQMAAADARVQIASIMNSRVQNMIKQYAETTGLAGNETVDQVNTSLSKPTTGETLIGTRIYRSRTSPTGGLYVLVGFDGSNAQKAVEEGIDNSMNNDQALWQEFKAKKAQEELAREIATQEVQQQQPVQSQSSIQTSMNNDKLLWEQFKSQKAQEELAREIAALEPKRQQQTPKQQPSQLPSGVNQERDDIQVVQDILELFINALTNRNMNKLLMVSQLNEEKKAFYETLFKSYQSFKIEVVPNSFFINTKDDFASVKLEIVDLINTDGNHVTTSANWIMIEINIYKRNDGWQKVSVM